MFFNCLGSSHGVRGAGSSGKAQDFASFRKIICVRSPHQWQALSERKKTGIIFLKEGFSQWDLQFPNPFAKENPALI